MVKCLRIYYIVLAALLFVSCHKDLCMDHHHDGMKLQVKFDWADLNPTTVQSMTLLLYPVEGGSPFRFPFSDINGGVISVTSGSYHVLCVNDDELLHLTDVDSWDKVGVTTGETDIVSRALFGNTRTEVPRANGTEDEPVLREPPLLYTDTCTSFYVKATDELQVLTLKPQMALGMIHVVIENVDNLTFLQTISGAVTGLSSSLNLTSLQESDERCTMPIKLHVNANGALEGNLYYFGHCPYELHGHNLIVYSMMIDTSKQAFDFDITPQMHPDDPGGGGGGQPDDEVKDREVIVPALPLPTPQPAEGGFDIKLDEWDTQSITIKM